MEIKENGMEKLKKIKNILNLYINFKIYFNICKFLTYFYLRKKNQKKENKKLRVSVILPVELAKVNVRKCPNK